jgi:membrane AbrB-like protein
VNSFWPDSDKRLRDTTLTLLAALVGGALFNWLDTPLPWTLGALAFTIIGATTHGRTYLPSQVRLVATPIFGVMIGSAFTGDITGQLGAWLLVVPGLLAFMASAIIVGMLYYQTVLQVDRHTAFCSALPGGLSEVILIAPSMRADTRTVVVSQVTRVVLLVFTIPFAFRLFDDSLGGAVTAVDSHSAQASLMGYGILLICAVAGCVLGKALRLPLALLTGPMLLSALAHAFEITDAVLPDLVIAAVQIIIGVFAGCRFAGVRLAEVRRTLLASIGWSCLLMLVTVAIALLGQWLTGVDLRELILALAPGGVQEMTLIALLLGADVAFVSALHILRITLIAGVVLPLYQGATNKQNAED